MRDCNQTPLHGGDRVEYVGPVRDFVGTCGTVLDGRSPADCVPVVWDTGYRANPRGDSLRLVHAARPPLREGEKRAYLQGFRAGGDHMERSFRDKMGSGIGVLDSQVQARLQFNRIAEAVEQSMRERP